MTTPAPRGVVVSGGGRGIGAAVARRLAAEGRAVAVLDVDAEGASAVAAELGRHSLALACDVGDAEQVGAAFRRVGESWGAIGGFVGAAGIELGVALRDMTAEQWNRTIATNLSGQFHCLAAALELLKRPGGSAVLVGSPVAHAAYPGATAYAASKGGVEALARAAAIDLAAEGLRVNAVIPGITDTAMLRGELAGSELERTLESARDAVPLGRVGEPADVADVVAFLLSDGARYVTGASLAVDGGLLARLRADA